MNTYKDLILKLRKAEPAYYVAVVVINAFGEVLLGERLEDGIWTTPAGGADPGETPEECAIRECFEEAGLLIDKDKLEPLPVSTAPNGKPVHRFLYRTTQLKTTVVYDPDEEVAEWLWFGPLDMPEALKRPKNLNRLESINEAYLKFHGLQKGGVGSGIKGHHTDAIKEYKAGVSRSEIGGFTTEVSKHLGKDSEKEFILDKDAKFTVKNVSEKGGVRHITLEPEAINKGGEGSGKRGHTTNKVIDLKNKLKDKTSGNLENAMTKLDMHHKELKDGAVIPNAKTQSGKPILTNMEHATAHGYTPEDHNDAMNIHYDLAQKFAEKIEQLQQMGHKIPDAAAKIKDFHSKKAKEHFRTGQKLSDRMKRTEEAKAEKKADVKKSTTQMGHFDAPDLNTGDYNAASKLQGDLLLKLQNMMENYQYGEVPRELDVDKGSISLVKVEEGLYTGYFRNVENDLEDNAKIRIERITIPDLVQLMIAKEWVAPLEKVPEVLESPDKEPQGSTPEAESSSLSEYQNYKIDMMRLISKLLD